MSSSTKMRHKKRQLIVRVFSWRQLVNRESWMLEMLLLGTTSYSSCAVQLNSVCPISVLYTRLFDDPFESDTPNTWSEEMCKRRLSRCLPRHELKRGIRKGVCRPCSPIGLVNLQQFRGPSSEPLSCCKL